MRQILNEAGFAELTWVDATEPSLTWFTEMRARLKGSPPLGLQVVMGPEFLEMADNLDRNLQAGRVRLVQTVLRRVG
jgi:hypothetical protein